MTMEQELLQLRSLIEQINIDREYQAKVVLFFRKENKKLLAKLKRLEANDKKRTN